MIRRPAAARLQYARSIRCLSHVHHQQMILPGSCTAATSAARRCHQNPFSSPSCRSLSLLSSILGSDTVEEAKTQDQLTSLLIPSSLPITSFLSPMAVTSFQSLPETQSILDIIDGKWNDNSSVPGEASQLIKQAEGNINRARDIFQSMPELHSATYLLEASLFSHVGQFDRALASLIRYQHSSTKRNPVAMQFVKAKLSFHSGKFTHALSEYEDILEYMEEEVERQMKNNSDNALPVIDGAAALTGVGLSKFMIHHTSQGDETNVDNTNQSEIIEAIQTATEMLLESRKDALLSVKHGDLALDLGLAAVISLTNFGIVQCIIANKKESSIKRWRQGLEVLDQILHDSVKSATVIPNQKYQCIQSLRARLYSNIACVLLELDGDLRGQNALAEVDEETLKEASEMAKKSLEVYDEILNGPNVASNDDASVDDAGDREELNETLNDNPESMEPDSDALDAKDIKMPPLWTEYHRAESARALGLVAMCYYHAGAAVTSEGLLQSALDASSSYPLGQCLKSEAGGVATKGVSLFSPNLALIGRDVRLEYALLCDKWDKRKGDAEKYRADASRIEQEGALKDFGGDAAAVSGLVSSIWLISPLDFQ